ncbi:hypothetical protein [Methylomonas sp. MgM2]
MKTLLLVLAVLAFISGLGILGVAKSAIHEIEAYVLYIVSAVLFSGSAIVGAINRLTNKLEKASMIVNAKPSPEILSTEESPKPSLEISECDVPFERDADSIKVSQKVDYTDKFAEKWKSGKN